MPPSVRALLDTSLSSYRHELLLDNVKGISILQQHGSIDDNVPVFHSRLMNQQITVHGANALYAELPGKNHWFDGIMTTQPLSEFFENELNNFARPLHAPEAFTLTVANPADSGPKFGVKILHLRRPGQLGKIHVSFSASDCTLRSSNVLSLRLPDIYPRTRGVVVDGQRIDLPLEASSNELWLMPDGTWKVCVVDEMFVLTMLTSTRFFRSINHRHCDIGTSWAAWMLYFAPRTLYKSSATLGTPAILLSRYLATSVNTSAPTRRSWNLEQSLQSSIATLFVLLSRAVYPLVISRILLSKWTLPTA
jgi:hypothetical protein